MWRFATQVLIVFGYDVSDASKEKPFFTTVLKILRVFWDIILLHGFISIIYTTFFKATAMMYVHAIDTTLLVILRPLTFWKREKIVLYSKLFRLNTGSASTKNNKVLGFIFITVFSMHLIRTLCNVGRSLIDGEGGSITILQIFSLHLIDTDALRTFRGKLAMSFIVIPINVLFSFLPFLMTVIIWALHEKAHEITVNFNKEIKNVFGSNGQDIEYVAKILSKMTEILKNLNQSLSPILFTLIAYYACNIFYLLSRLLVHNNFQTKLTDFTTVVTVITFTLQFMVTVHLASRVEEEILRSKDIIFKITCNSFREHLFEIQVFASLLDAAQRQIVVTILGVFKLDKSFIFFIFGFIITYEVIILQVLYKDN